MTEAKFSCGDPVWSKMKGYCPWPSRIADPSESTLRNTAADKLKAPKVHYLVYFFGSNNFAWMPEDTIKPYEEFKDKNKGGSKNAQFKQGLKQIEDYISNGGKATLVDTASGAAIKNNTIEESATSPSAAGDSLSNDASNIDGKYHDAPHQPLRCLASAMTAVRGVNPRPSPMRPLEPIPLLLTLVFHYTTQSITQNNSQQQCLSFFIARPLVIG